jgi:hypothetical protein
MPVGSIDTQHSEASRKQYILVWVLNSILTTLITFVPDQILSELAQSLVQVSNIYIASITINLVEVLMHFLILIFVYAIFKNIFIQRVMPYFLISGVLSFLVMAGKAVNELGAIYFSKELILIDITSCLRPQHNPYFSKKLESIPLILFDKIYLNPPKRSYAEVSAFYLFYLYFFSTLKCSLGSILHQI